MSALSPTADLHSRHALVWVVPDSDVAVGVRGYIEVRRTVTWHLENSAHHVLELPHCR